jgi:hypothetical protein
MAAHESPRTTKLYDRTGDEIRAGAPAARIPEIATLQRKRLAAFRNPCSVGCCLIPWLDWVT